MNQPQTITLPLEQAQAIRAYFGTRPHDEVALACFWLDVAIQSAPEGQQRERVEQRLPDPESLRRFVEAGQLSQQAADELIALAPYIYADPAVWPPTRQTPDAPEEGEDS